MRYGLPSKEIHSFQGMLGDQKLDVNQFLIRGCTLKASKDVYAVVVYTGVESKLIMNQGEYNHKISSDMYALNFFLLFHVAVFVLSIVLLSMVGNRQGTKYLSGHYYIFEETIDGEVSAGKYANLSVMTFYIIMNGLFPLDLPIAIMFVRTFYTYLHIENDVEMISEEASEPDKLVGCSVKNIGVIEDLAKVNYIFSDKTGTLTKNELVFKAMAFGDSKLRDSDMSFKGLPEPEVKILDKLLRCLSICHEVFVFQDENGNKSF